MIVWRLCTRAHADSAFSGDGAREFGGRWNPVGIPVVYTCSSLSLAVLEYFVHVDSDILPDTVAIPASVPEGISITTLDEGDLPGDWRRVPAPARLKEIGAEWARSAATVVLAVPSVVVPEERVFVLNPEHAEFFRIQIGEPRSFEFDPRMWKA